MKLHRHDGTEWGKKHRTLMDKLDTAIKRAKAPGISFRERIARQELVHVAQSKLAAHRAAPPEEN